jgi:hypothetical protein
MNDTIFRPVTEATWRETPSAAPCADPVVFRGLAAGWPAVRHWSFDGLSSQVSDQPVQLVDGNREKDATRFVPSTLHNYLQSLQAPPTTNRPHPYLKEFDLLKAAPALRKDLPHEELLPRRHLRSLRSWIGPAGASTGLHYDYLDNLAVQVLGVKRWRLARPGTVERMNAVSTKYDSWAVLSSSKAQELASRVGDDGRNDFFTVDLRPGDVLQLPAGWWHEVTNLSASVLFGGFHGPRAAVLARWAWVSARDMMHRRGWLARHNCTCHPQ